MMTGRGRCDCDCTSNLKSDKRGGEGGEGEEGVRYSMIMRDDTGEGDGMGAVTQRIMQ